MSEETSHGRVNDRRRFLRNSAMTVAAAAFVIIGSADAQSSKTVGGEQVLC
jgi:hypothetical protein